MAENEIEDLKKIVNQVTLLSATAAEIISAGQQTPAATTAASGSDGERRLEQNDSLASIDSQGEFNVTKLLVDHTGDRKEQIEDAATIFYKDEAGSQEPTDHDMDSNTVDTDSLQNDLFDDTLNVSVRFKPAAGPKALAKNKAAPKAKAKSKAAATTKNSFGKEQGCTQS